MDNALCFFAVIFSPAGIDLYVALIPEISTVYQVNAEYALSIYFLGMGIGTLFARYLYDRF
jgi:MFS family permease